MGPMDDEELHNLFVAIDSGALTTIIRYPQDLELFDHLPSFFIHHLGNSYERSLHIGAGGGIDLLAAHHYGVSKVHGVEINPLIVDVVKNQFDDYAGGIYTGRLDGVHIHLGEGRSFLERSAASDAYDLIQLSGVDTSSSSQAGAYALSENNLYTTEAFASYLSHLRPGGILTLSRWYRPDQKGRKTYSLRLVNVVRAAFRRLGLDPDGRIFFFRQAKRGGLTVIAVKIEPFTQEESNRGLAFLERNRSHPTIVPGQRLGNIYEEFLYAPDDEHERLLLEYPYRVGAPTDDSPFFFEIQRLGNVFRVQNGIWGTNTITGQETLVVILAELIALGVVLLGIPLGYLARRRRVALPWRWLCYFALIGFAYMAIEISLSQKLVLYLGHPTYALSVVLAGMLVFSGMGSFLSPRLAGRERSALAALVVVLVVVGLVMTPLLDFSLRVGFGARVAVSLAMIAPIGILMGLPMPMAIRRADQAAIPFFWGVNGFFSVVGSVVTVVLSVNSGFSRVFAVATLCYLVAAFAFSRKS